MVLHRPPNATRYVPRNPDAPPGPAAVVPRSTYRHGDLRRALIDAGMELARAGGPDAVVLREATRRAGVVPNAAYRHFANRDELLGAVRAAAFAAAASCMERELAELGPADGSEAFARATVRAVGRGYLRFAQEETGLFRTAFTTRRLAPPPRDPANAGPGGLTPFELLGAALDRLVETGALPAARRPGAEVLAWSTVHGLALLLLDGPMQPVPPEQAEALSQLLLDMVERGL